MTRATSRPQPAPNISPFTAARRRSAIPSTHAPHYAIFTPLTCPPSGSWSPRPRLKPSWAPIIEPTASRAAPARRCLAISCGANGDSRVMSYRTAAPSTISTHNIGSPRTAESAALAVKAGCDMSCICTYEHLGEAVERGLITEADIDLSLGRTLATRFKLGIFDPQDQVPFAALPMSVVGCDEHRGLAYEAALKSIVLLKNKDGVLPIGARAGSPVRHILLVGPNAASLDVLFGNYHGLSERLVTLLEGIAERAPEGVKIEYRPGCQLVMPIVKPNRTEGDWSIYVAVAADLVIACMGLSPLLEGEEGDAILSTENGDRAEIGLPAPQVAYLTRLLEVGARVVLVLTAGSPIALGDLEERLEAVVYAWYPGQEGGRAVADVLFGSAVPSGKLPLTFPCSLEQLPPFEDYRMTGRTYRYATHEPLYPFGFGLSYTRFAYSDLL